MNYRHAYHAGNFADVFKHVLLILVIDTLLAKEKPFCYLDTHAGIGRYNLKSDEAQKTKEFEVGIAQIMKQTTQKPQVIEQYLQIVQSLNPDGDLKYYPGSPRIARALLRPNDKMILTELHPIDFKLLKEEFKNDKQVAVHLLDGYLGLKAFLPPEPRRGLVLIDPPFEASNEFSIIVQSLMMAIKRWREGIYLVWYPIKDRDHINSFEQLLRRELNTDILLCELNLYPDDSPLALNGSGMAIINPPWKFKEKASDIIPWLLKSLDKQNRGHYRIAQL